LSKKVAEIGKRAKGSNWFKTFSLDLLVKGLMGNSDRMIHLKKYKVL